MPQVVQYMAIINNNTRRLENCNTRIHRRSVGKKSEGAQQWSSEDFGSEDIQQNIFIKIYTKVGKN